MFTKVWSIRWSARADQSTPDTESQTLCCFDLHWPKSNSVIFQAVKTFKINELSLKYLKEYSWAPLRTSLFGLARNRPSALHENGLERKKTKALIMWRSISTETDGVEVRMIKQHDFCYLKPCLTCKPGDITRQTSLRRRVQCGLWGQMNSRMNSFSLKARSVLRWKDVQCLGIHNFSFSSSLGDVCTWI